MELKLQPFVMVLRQALDELVEKDPGTIFTEPVDLKEVNLKFVNKVIILQPVLLLSTMIDFILSEETCFNPLTKLMHWKKA